MFKPEDLIKIANQAMPFGRYQGHRLIDIPEEYYLWFAKKGFPEGELGQLMALCLQIKSENLEYLIRPLKTVEKKHP